MAQVRTYYILGHRFEEQVPKFERDETVLKWVGGNEDGRWHPFIVDGVKFKENGTPKYRLRSHWYKGMLLEAQMGGEAGMRTAKGLDLDKVDLQDLKEFPRPVFKKR